MWGGVWPEQTAPAPLRGFLSHSPGALSKPLGVILGSSPALRSHTWSLSKPRWLLLLNQCPHFSPLHWPKEIKPHPLLSGGSCNSLLPALPWPQYSSQRILPLPQILCSPSSSPHFPSGGRGGREEQAAPQSQAALHGRLHSFWCPRCDGLCSAQEPPTAAKIINQAY